MKRELALTILVTLLSANLAHAKAVTGEVGKPNCPMMNQGDTVADSSKGKQLIKVASLSEQGGKARDQKPQAGSSSANK